MNILIVGSKDTENQNIAFTKNHIAEIKKAAPNAKITIAEDDKTTDKFIGNTDVLIHSYGRKVPWEKATKLKWVHSGSAGVTDLAKELLDHPAKLTNSSGVHPIPISEWVLGAMLFFAKRFDLSFRKQIKGGGWSRSYSEMKGFELNGATIGIVGYGRIGKQIGKAARAIGMKIAVFEHTKKIKDKNVDKVYKNLNELLETSDFIVNCLPYTGETEGYFNLKLFRKMKKTAYFLNIGRGKTVVEQNLAEALKKKIIKGAALDVTAVEPLPDSSPLWKLDNILITPHISSWTPQYTDRLIEIFCKNLKAYIVGRPMPTLVDKKRGY